MAKRGQKRTATPKHNSGFESRTRLKSPIKRRKVFSKPAACKSVSALRNQTQRNQKNILFSPVPQVHEFDINSPASRRMEIKEKTIGKLSDESVYLELIVRGFKLGSKNEVSDSHRTRLHEIFCDEFKKELVKVGIVTEGSLQDLQRKVDLLRSLIQRAHIRTMYNGVRPLPVDMSTEDMISELKSKKVVLPSDVRVNRSLNFDSAVKQPNRKDLIDFLEKSLLKDAVGMRIPGYEFGKTFVSSSDIVEYQYFLNFGEEAEIDEAEMEADELVIEEVLRGKLQKDLIEVMEIEVEQLQKTLGSKSKRNIIKRTKSDEENETDEDDTTNSLQSTESSGSLLTLMASPKTKKEHAREKRLALLNNLFSTLFDSNVYNGTDKK